MEYTELTNILDKILVNNDKYLSDKIASFLNICEGCGKINYQPSEEDEDLCPNCFGNLELTFSICLISDSSNIEEIFINVSKSDYIQEFDNNEKHRLSEIIEFIGGFISLPSWNIDKINKLINMSYKLMKYEEIQKSRKRRKVRRLN